MWRLKPVLAVALEHGLSPSPTRCTGGASSSTRCGRPATSDQGVEASEATGFRIGVAVRLPRPRKHATNRDGLVLPDFPQRLRLLMDAAPSDEDPRTRCVRIVAGSAGRGAEGAGRSVAGAAATLLEEQQLDAVTDQAEAQARERAERRDASSVSTSRRARLWDITVLTSVMVPRGTPLTAPTASPWCAEQKASADDDAEKKRKKRRMKAKDADVQTVDGVKSNGSKLLLVQLSKVVMFIPGKMLYFFVSGVRRAGDAARRLSARRYSGCSSPPSTA